MKVKALRLPASFSSPDGPLAQGLFDARAYYARENVFYQLQAASTNDIRLAGQGVSLRAPLSERFRRWAMKTLALGLPVEDEPLRLTWTLLLDWKAPLTVEVEEPFMRAGTYHILAVDGLRMWLLAGNLPRSVATAATPSPGLRRDHPARFFGSMWI